MIKDILEELKYSKNIFYGDDIYILPYHLVSNQNSFNDLRRVTVTTIKTEGSNNHGCEVIGKVIYYDENDYPIENYYSGYAIYRAKKDKVITNNGEFFVYFDEKEREYYLSDDKKYRIYYKFKVSDGIFIKLLVGGNYCFNNKEDAMNFSKKIKIKKCLLDISGITLFMNKAKIFYKNYSIILDNKEFFNDKTKEDLWQHMICHEKPYIQNQYHMDYSKIFLLEPLGFHIE